MKLKKLVFALILFHQRTKITMQLCLLVNIDVKVLTKVRNELKRSKIKTTCSYKRESTQNKWFLSQQSKQKQNKIKIGFFTAMILMQYIHRKHLWWSLFLKKLQNFRPATLLKRDPNTGVFLWILQKIFY